MTMPSVMTLSSKILIEKISGAKAIIIMNVK